MWPLSRSDSPVLLPPTGLSPQSLVGFRSKPGSDRLLKGRIIHEAPEDFFILIHTLNEEGFQHILEHQLEHVLRVHLGRLPKRLVRRRRFDDLIEKKLIGLVEIRPEPFTGSVSEKVLETEWTTTLDYEYLPTPAAKASNSLSQEAKCGHSERMRSNPIRRAAVGPCKVFL